MRIRQQKQIGMFLAESFGGDRGGALFARQKEILQEIIRNTQNRSKNQRKTLVQTILPRIALYKAMQESLPEAETHAQMRRYMLERVAAQKHAEMMRMEAIPGFYALYSRIFLRVVRSSDLWESEQEHGTDGFSVTMKKCLWHTACVENGCAELCRLFCDVDDVTYGGLCENENPWLRRRLLRFPVLQEITAFFERSSDNEKMEKSFAGSCAFTGGRWICCVCEDKLLPDGRKGHDC